MLDQGHGLPPSQHILYLLPVRNPRLFPRCVPWAQLRAAAPSSRRTHCV
ncbi:hypothetical protein HMPREF3293_01445 [Christensenella minuta]|uniref:Uncharacterized protein n=1 Tax=Christensenella minuta TaxID=626937 RepID=A0A136Q4X6_9FIRM|nr:hypothetical protein HMPREF3293_01445 [Christensenella minuta]